MYTTESTKSQIWLQCIGYDINSLIQNQMSKPYVEMERLGSFPCESDLGYPN